MRIILANICLLGVGFIAATFIQEYFKSEIIDKNKENEKALITQITKLNIRLDRQKTFIEEQTKAIDQLQWKNSEKSILNHKIDQYRKKTW